MKRNIPLHPFLFTLFPVVHLYVVNSNDYPLKVVIKPLIFLLAATAFLLVILRIMTKNSHKAAAISSVFLLWFFSFGPLRELWTSLNILSRQRYFLAIYGLSGFVMLYRTVKAKGPFLKATTYFNLMGAILVSAALVNFIFAHQWKKAPPTEEQKVPAVEGQSRLPDIYYIILDAHTSERQMKEVLDCDCSGFIQFLKEKGFYVAPNSHSNYAFTRFSLASSLNMEYLPMDADPGDPNRFMLRKNVNFTKMIKKSKVAGFLRSKGYEYVELAIWDDTYIAIDFNMGLVHTTVFSIPYVENWMDALFVKGFVRDSLKSLERICREGPGKRSPVFVYAHIMLPHFPYMFEKDGGATPFFLIEKEAYCEQAKFAQRKMRAMFENLLSRAGANSVIILQGDHGYGLTRDPVKDEALKMSNLNAYYLPGRQGAGLYDTITPVNSFRVIFNEYFNANYPLLEDRSYFQRVEQERLRLHKPEITGVGK